MDEIKKTQTNSDTTSQPTIPTTEAADVDPVFAQIEGELKTRFELLPTELQQVILSSDYQMHLFDVAKKYKLTYEKLGQLELETTMVILGMTPPDEYKLEVAEQMGLAGTDLDNVVAEINEKVFSPIREKLMALYSEEEVKKGEEFAKAGTSVVEPAPSPYREPIEIKKPPQPGINTSAIPTLDKNEFDSKKEGGVATINPVKIGLDINPVVPTTPTAQPTNPQPIFDPYRELPEGITPPPSPGIVHEATPSIDTTVTQEFLKTIPTLGSSITSKPAQATTEQALEIAKRMGALETMPQVQSAPVLKEQNQAEKLQSIAEMKNILGAKLAPKENVQPTIQTPPEIKTRPDPGIVAPSIDKQPVVSKTTVTGPKETSELVRNIKLQLNETANTLNVKPETLQK